MTKKALYPPLDERTWTNEPYWNRAAEFQRMSTGGGPVLADVRPSLLKDTRQESLSFPPVAKRTGDLTIGSSFETAMSRRCEAKGVAEQVLPRAEADGSNSSLLYAL